MILRLATSPIALGLIPPFEILNVVDRWRSLPPNSLHRTSAPRMYPFIHVPRGGPKPRAGNVRPT